jgi:hypothetical protein
MNKNNIEYNPVDYVEDNLEDGDEEHLLNKMIMKYSLWMMMYKIMMKVSSRIR